MKEQKTIERQLEDVDKTNVQAHQNIDRNLLLRLIQQLIQLLTSLLQEQQAPQQDYRREIEKIPPAPEIINNDAPFCEPKDPEIQRAEIAKSIEKIEEKLQEDQEKAPERQRQRQKGQDLTR